MKFEQRDSVLFPKHLGALPEVRDALCLATHRRPTTLLVDEVAVEFVPMDGAPGPAAFEVPRETIGSWPPPLRRREGPPTAFDAYVIADWSANRTPKTGPDSIWWTCAIWEGDALSIEAPQNPPTRAHAREQIRARLQGLVAERKSVLLGFDFPYGYPAGLAQRLGLRDAAPWRAMWREVTRAIDDRQGDRGTNNRFEVAAGFNRVMGGSGPFWGCPNNAAFHGLTSKKPAPPWPVPEFRVTERRVRGPKSAFQLNGAGSVGGQVLMGLPVLEWLRSHPAFDPISQVWPFETGAALPARPSGARIVHAEIYPSLVEHPVPPGWFKDQAQVVALAHRLAALDASNELQTLFEAPKGHGREVVEEEGWILGVR